MNMKAILLSATLAAATFAIANEVKPEQWALANGWSVDNADIVSGKGGVFVNLKEKKNSSSIEFEADITPMQAESPSWKTAGLAIVLDGKNFWRLSLVETPDKDGKKHYVELKQMKDGKWGVNTGLKNLSHKGGSFNWEYNATYKMKLSIGDGKISGVMLDKDGKEVTNIAFSLGDDAIAEGSPALTGGTMGIRYSNISIKGL